MPASHIEEFENALKTHAARYEVELNSDAVAGLRDYYKMVIAWNARLHLVAPCSPTEFAARHVLESLMLLPHLPQGACVADVGSGAGLPIIPCLIARPDVTATLIESSAKKAVFLREALRLINRHNASDVIAERFEKLAPPVADFITCRALERFVEMFPKLIAWSAAPASTLLFFGGAALQERIKERALPYTAIHIPNSERRFLFIIRRTSMTDKAEETHRHTS